MFLSSFSRLICLLTRSLAFFPCFRHIIIFFRSAFDDHCQVLWQFFFLPFLYSFASATSLASRSFFFSFFFFFFFFFFLFLFFSSFILFPCSFLLVLLVLLLLLLFFFLITVKTLRFFSHNEHNKCSSDQYGVGR